MTTFTVDAKILQDSLNRANKLVSRVKRTMFISPGVLFRVRERILTVFATDIDSWIIQDIPIYEGEEGEVFVPVSELIKLIKGFKRIGALRFVEGEDVISVFGEGLNSEYEIKKLNRDEFPNPPDYSILEGFTIDLGELVEGLELVGWCSAENDSRVFLNGVYFHSRDGYLNLVASDGTILGKTSDIKFGGNIKGIIPVNFLDVLKILEKGSAIIKVEDGYMYLTTNIDEVNVNLIIRLINEEYANYESLIPFEFISGATVNRDDLLEALERILNFLPDTGEINLDVNDGNLVLSTISVKGRGLEKIGCDTFGSISVKMFGNHIRNIVKKLEYEKVDIKFSGENTPIYISPSGNDKVIFLTIPLS